jgi:hypothetical protein
VELDLGDAHLVQLAQELGVGGEEPGGGGGREGGRGGEGGGGAGDRQRVGLMHNNTDKTCA